MWYLSSIRPLLFHRKIGIILSIELQKNFTKFYSSALKLFLYSAQTLIYITNLALTLCISFKYLWMNIALFSVVFFNLQFSGEIDTSFQLR